MNTAVPSRNGCKLTSSRWWFLLLIVVCTPASAAEAAAPNPHLQSALRLFRDGKYEKSLQVLDQAKQWPSNTMEDTISIALLEGVLSYETHEPERGDSAFRRALEHDLKAKLPYLVSPKIAPRLDQLREQLQREQLQREQLQREQLQREQSASLSRQIPEPRPEAPEPPGEPKPSRRTNLKLPVAIGGGVVTVSGLLMMGKAMSLEGKVRRAVPSITTRAQLEDTLQQGKTFNKVGWILMGLGAATTASSLLFLDTPAPGVQGTVTPVAHGAQVSLFWSLP